MRGWASAWRPRPRGSRARRRRFWPCTSCGPKRGPRPCATSWRQACSPSAASLRPAAAHTSRRPWPCASVSRAKWPRRRAPARSARPWRLPRARLVPTPSPWTTWRGPSKALPPVPSARASGAPRAGSTSGSAVTRRPSPATRRGLPSWGLLKRPSAPRFWGRSPTPRSASAASRRRLRAARRPPRGWGPRRPARTWHSATR
ncbi:hypothetical protein D3C86_1242150 [compost metagenome]